MSATFGSRNIFTQIGALANIVNQLQNWCRRYFLAYSDKYIWLASSPNINTGDFMLCLILENDFTYFIFMCVISERIPYDMVSFVRKFGEEIMHFCSVKIKGYGGSVVMVEGWLFRIANICKIFSINITSSL